MSRNTEINENLLFGFVGKQIDPADNLDIFDTLNPLWNNRHLLSRQEKSLLYAFGVMYRHIRILESEITKLKEQSRIPVSGGKRKSSKRKSSKRK